MKWNEQDHPRDDDGKFTFKNGGVSGTKESSASILYRDEKIKKEKDKIESEYKSKLLNILGNKATSADILYGTTKELEEKVKEYGLEDKLKGTMTGGASGIENQETKQKAKLLPKIELGDIQTPFLKGGISYDEIKTDSNIKPVSNVTTNLNKTWNTDEGFRKAMPHLFNREGDYSNHALDKGGKTKYGITEGTLKHYRDNYGKFKDTNIGSLTKEQAAQIYYDEYWKKSGADKIKDKDLAYVHFDATVNHGLGNSKKFLEQSGGDFDKYIEIRRNFYKAIVKNNPKQDVFLKGWMNRLDEIKKNKGKY